MVHYHFDVTLWRYSQPFGVYRTPQSGNSGTPEPPGGQHTFWNIPEDLTNVYKVKLQLLCRQLTTSYQAIKLALEQPPNHGTEIQDL